MCVVLFNTGTSLCEFRIAKNEIYENSNCRWERHKGKKTVDYINMYNVAEYLCKFVEEGRSHSGLLFLQCEISNRYSHEMSLQLQRS